MMSYYTVLIALCWMALGVLCILVYENSWIPREDKRLFYMTYTIIALIYLIITLVLQAGLNTSDLKLFSAIVVAVALAIPALKKGKVKGGDR